MSSTSGFDAVEQRKIQGTGKMKKKTESQWIHQPNTYIFFTFNNITSAVLMLNFSLIPRGLLSWLLGVKDPVLWVAKEWSGDGNLELTLASNHICLL